MNTTFVIRRVDPDTEALPIFKPLRLRALATDPAQLGSNLAREEAFDDETWKSRSRTAHLAFVDGVSVGLIGHLYEDEIWPDRKPEEGKKRKGLLLAFWVAPEYRRRGIGSALVRQIVSEVVEKEGNELSLNVKGNNEEAKSVYLKEGFQLTGRGERDGELVMHYATGLSF
ncbi:acyl-CoA N-acyltransferase [Atractiella rhizophila]|nr:acyl-CoA N-acyltransferase [Atractiella rhizophila]